MFRQKAFTIIELMIAILVVGVLSTLAVTNYNDSVARSNFKMMREVAAKFALSQQEHRQRYGAYASTVQSSGNSAASTMIFAEANNYTVKVSKADFKTFEATIEPNANQTTYQTPDNCKKIQITSEQGYLSYVALDRADKDTTTTCMPNG
jgi:prepilin-type N-terminal cleavage/methylation domain-containing protein